MDTLDFQRRPSNILFLQKFFTLNLFHLNDGMFLLIFFWAINKLDYCVQNKTIFALGFPIFYNFLSMAISTNLSECIQLSLKTANYTFVF